MWGKIMRITAQKYKYFELNARSLVNARFACSNFIVIKSITCGAAFPLPKKFRVQPSFFGSPMSFCLSSLPLPDGNVNILYFFDMGIIYRRGGRPRPPMNIRTNIDKLCGMRKRQIKSIPLDEGRWLPVATAYRRP